MSKIGGQISRSGVIARARYWLGAGLTYCQSGYAWEVDPRRVNGDAREDGPAASRVTPDAARKRDLAIFCGPKGGQAPVPALLQSPRITRNSIARHFLRAAFGLAMACTGATGCSAVADDEPEASPSASQTTGELASSSTCSGGAIVAINTADNLLYRWTRPSPISGGFTAAASVGKEWGGIRLIVSDAATGDLFAIGEDGWLRRYWYEGSHYTGGTELKDGFGHATQLLGAGNGILYTVSDDGYLRWYHWTPEGGLTNDSGKTIDRGWQGFTAFGGGNGIIYAIAQNSGGGWTKGDLIWHRHLNPFSPTNAWYGPRKVGTSWHKMHWTVSLGSGVIYAVNENYDLLYYQNTGYADGTATWANSGQGQKIGSGWQSYRNLTANPNACPTEPAGTSTHLWTECVPYYGPAIKGQSFNGNGQTVAVDGSGRPWHAQRRWRWGENPSGGSRNDSCQLSVGYWGGNPTYNGGHLIPDVMGGWGGRANLIPQNAQMNKSVWSTVENAASRCVQTPAGKGGYDIQYGVTVSYPDITEVRPTELTATLFVIAGDRETSASITLPNRAPGDVERKDATEFKRAVDLACAWDYIQFKDSDVWGDASALWWPLTEPEVQYTRTSPVQVRAEAADGLINGVKLQRCSSGCDASTDRGFVDVPESVTAGFGRSLWVPALRFSEYRACRQTVPDGPWACMQAGVVPPSDSPN